MLVKRIFDFIVSGIVFLLILPVLIIVFILIYLMHGPPVFFRQKRPGLKGEIFECLKFRTMKNSFDENGNPLPDEKRITCFGAFLRNTSLDELPEIINVLKGEMSLVGPRPLLVEYLPLYSPRHSRRHDVKPGITGWAQVNGRNAISWNEKFELDIWYVENWSLMLDLKILILTIWNVFSRTGISAKGHATMPKFSGYGSE
jgi:lipopolysaccharide/colanic/teichoic acid biosynthesis glycosyltransferase